MASQREQFNPDIEIKYDHLLRHMAEKNSVVDEFIRILKEICDAEIFYSRSLDKFANNISKLMIGKDPLKEVLIIFERAVAAKSEQAMELANSIKDDMIPFIEKEAIDVKEQNDLRGRQKLVKDTRAHMQRKLKNLHISENNYKRSYEQLKRYGQAESRQQVQEKERAQRMFAQRETAFIETINSYNHTVEQYLLNYTLICEKLSDIETKRKLTIRDAVNKYMIFEISCIKNIEYNIPRYMKSLEKMGDRLVIQDKPNPQADSQTELTNLAKININNYISNLNDRDKIDIPNAHKKILEIKKQTEPQLTPARYHALAAELISILDETILSNDVRVLKEIVYFARAVGMVIGNIGSETIIGQNEQESKKRRFVGISLLDSVMCHRIFQNVDFWGKYQQRLFDIIQRQSNHSLLDTQNKEVQISLSFLAPDIEFLRIVSIHSLPHSILSKFTIIDERKSPSLPDSKPPNPAPTDLQNYITRTAGLL